MRPVPARVYRLGVVFLLTFVAKAASAQPGPSLQPLGAIILPNALSIEGVPVGGISAVAYDSVDARWYLLSDDHAWPAAVGDVSRPGRPARVYPARLEFSGGHLSGVEILPPIHIMVSAQRGTGPGSELDPEGMAFSHATRTLLYTSEGNLQVEPLLAEIDLQGSQIREVPLPPIFASRDVARGSRGNLNLEAFSLSPDARSAWLATEAPVRQDGPPPTGDAGAPIRLTRVSLPDGRVLAQHVYMLDPHCGTGGADAAANGVSEVLVVEEDRLLVMERCFANLTGNTVRLYLATIGRATDVRERASLLEGGYTAVGKQLVADLRPLGSANRPNFRLPVDNFEGMGWGPALPDGKRILLLVSDDNFNPQQQTVLLAFAYTP